MTWPVPLLVMWTLASLTSAPLGSVTVPTILPVLIVVWANTPTEIKRNADTMISGNKLDRVLHLKDSTFNIAHRPFFIFIAPWLCLPGRIGLLVRAITHCITPTCVHRTSLTACDIDRKYYSSIVRTTVKGTSAPSRGMFSGEKGLY